MSKLTNAVSATAGASKRAAKAIAASLTTFGLWMNTAPDHLSGLDWTKGIVGSLIAGLVIWLVPNAKAE